MGTAVGTKVYNADGWRPAAALSVGWQGFCLLVILARGPHCKRYTWFGYEGGLDWHRERPAQQDAEKAVSSSNKGGDTSEAQTRAPSMSENKGVVQRANSYEDDKGPLSESQTRVPTPSPDGEEKRGEDMTNSES